MDDGLQAQAVQEGSPVDAPPERGPATEPQAGSPEPERFESPRDTTSWVLGRQDGIETFTAPDGRVWTRPRGDEPADAIVTFTGPGGRGLLPLRLVLAASSYALKGAATRKRRANAELRRRGYDVD